MIENTLENKAKFFGVYAHQKVWKQQTYPSVLDWVDDIDYKDQFFNDAYLLLKLLSSSSITDEDAIELVKIHGYIENQLTKESGRSLVNSIMKGTDIPFFYVKKERFGHMIDYLRSKGYALPYMGASVETMVKWGWIKLKED